MHLFVQPHFDDVALSCGGTVALQSELGGSAILTVFGAAAERDQHGPLARQLHEEWGTGDDTPRVRDQEDQHAARILNARRAALPFREAIYRGYREWPQLFGAVPEDEMDLQRRVAEALVSWWQALRAEVVYLPLALGGHVDHRMVHAALPALVSAGAIVWCYEDFPYALRDRPRSPPDEIVDVTKFLDRRIAAIGAHRSQLAGLFGGADPAEVVSSHARSRGAHVERFWRPSSSIASSMESARPYT
jgi:LmbE family N-acetylglucosaminyl deacetylase